MREIHETPRIVSIVVHSGSVGTDRSKGWAIRGHIVGARIAKVNLGQRVVVTDKAMVRS